MLDPLIKSVERVFVDFNLRRLLYVLFLLSVVLVAVYLFNEFTGYSFFRRMDGRVSALERLSRLERDGIVESPSLAPIYRSLTSELRDFAPEPLRYHLDWTGLVKFASAAGIPILLALLAVLQRLAGLKDWRDLFWSGTALGLILGIPAVLVPTWASLWIVSITYLAAQTLVFAVIYRLGRGDVINPTTLT